MGIGAEVLASTVQDLWPKYSELFLVWNPVLDRIILKGGMERGRLEAPYKEFSVVYGGPGTVTVINTGNEVIEGGRTEATVKGNTYASRHIYAWDVPLLDLATTNTKTQVGNLLQRYPETGLAEFQAKFEEQFLVGNGSSDGDLTGYPTLNGNAKYTDLSGSARNGVFDFAVKASQTNTVFNIAKEGTTGTTGWYNQWNDVNSFRLHGKKRMRNIFWACNRQGSKPFGKIDLILADNESFENYADILDEQVRVTNPTDVKQGDRVVPKDDRPMLQFAGADILQCDLLNRSATQFSGTTAADGLMYFLNTSTWMAFTQGQDKDKETNGDFALRGPFRLPEEDKIRFEYVAHMGIYCVQLRANGVLTGTADE